MLCALLTMFSARAAITSGSYYVIKNVANGQYLAGGNDYGTQGCTFDMPQWFQLETYSDGFSILSGQPRDNNHKYFGTNLYMDSNRAAWTITEVTTGVYTISNGSGYLRSNGRNHAIAQNGDAPDDAAKWQIFTRDELGTAILTGASFAKGIDATPYIGRPGFSRKYETGTNPWTVTGYNGEGSPSNYADAAHGEAGKSWYCAESYHSTNGFKVSQTITNLKPGLYSLRAHAFYRQDDDITENIPYMFVGSQKSYFPQKIRDENSMETAYNSFLSGNYSVGAILFTVTSTSDVITIGYAGDANHIWNIFGQTQLTYYGNSNPQENDDMTGLIVNPSFESANFEGWTLKALSSDTGIRNAEMTGKDGTWLFNTWWQGVPLTQGLGALPGGRYKLTATVASSDGNGPGKVFLIVNGVPNDGTECAKSTENTGYPAEYVFTQSGTGNVTIGAVGAAADFSYTSDGHWWYKADNFKLTYLGEDPEIYADALKDAQDAAKAIDSDAPMKATVKSALEAIIASDGNTEISEYEKAADVKAAIKALNDAAEDATTSISIYESISSAIDDYQDLADELDAAGQAAYDVSAIQTKYGNGTYETLAEAKTELNTAYVNAVRSQNTDGADMTNLMVNPAVTSTTGWTNGRTAADQQYTGAPDNTYMDTWNATLNQYQYLSLPAGYYLLKAATRADATLTANANIYVLVGETNNNNSPLHKEGASGNLLGNGWGWTYVPFSLTEATKISIGFYSVCDGSKWAGADDFHLYYYTTELAMKQAQVAQVVSDANAWADKLTTTTALETALAASAPSCSTVEECNTAISNLETTIANARAAEAPYASFNALKTAANAIAAVAYTETTPGSHTTFEGAITAQTSAADGATTVEGINTATSTLKAAIKTYINGAEPENEGEYFDITCLIENPTFENNNATGWSGTTPNAITYGCAEFFNMNFDFNQNITGLANGSYQLSVQAYCRPGDNGDTSAGAYYDYTQGISNITAELYVNSDESTIGNIYSYKGNTTSAKVAGNDFHCNISTDDYWVPNNMQGASLYFADKAYNTTVAALVEDGNLKIGFREENKKTNQWVIFDNFRLYYYGSSKMIYYKQYLPQLEANIEENFLNNGAYAVLKAGQTERTALATANAADAEDLDTEEELQDAIDDIIEARDNFVEAKGEYDNLSAKITTANSYSNNKGEGVFQITNAAWSTLESQITTSQGVYDTGTTSKASVTTEISTLNTAINTATSTLVAPAAEKRYCIVLSNNGDWTYDEKAITYLANARNDMGNYNVQYEAAPSANYAQAFILTQVEGNTYKMSQIDVDGNERYICTGKAYTGGNTSQIRTTTDDSKALVVRIEATSTANIFNIYNTEANQYIGSQDAGVYTVNTHKNFTIEEASKAAAANLTVKSGKLGTFIAPFKVTLPAKVKAYSATANNTQVTLEKFKNGGEDLPAGTPVIIYGDGEDTSVDFDADYSAVNGNKTVGALTGILVDTTVPEGAYVLQTQAGTQAFYQLDEDAAGKLNRCYVTAEVEQARLIISFDDEDPTAINAIEAANAKAEGLKDGKYLIDNKIVLVKNGVKYSANGQILK